MVTYAISFIAGMIIGFLWACAEDKIRKQNKTTKIVKDDP